MQWYEKNKKNILIQPIRAHVMYTENNGLAVEKAINHVVHSGYKLLESNEYEKITRPIGYLCSWIPVGEENENRFRFGYSFCLPEDYRKFSKEVGLKLAFTESRCVIPKMSDDEDPLLYFDRLEDNFKQNIYTQKLLNTRAAMSGTDAHAPKNEKRIVTYLFQYTLMEQLVYFINRCVAYYR